MLMKVIIDNMMNLEVRDVRGGEEILTAQISRRYSLHLQPLQGTRL